MPAEVPLLKVENLSVTYGALKALVDVSWEVGAGQILGIIGPNGAGKSTCFDATTNMVTRKGRVHFSGTDITKLPAWQLAPLGIRRTFQQNVFFSELSALQNMTGALLRRLGTPLLTAALSPWKEYRRRKHAEDVARSLLVQFGVPEQFHGLNPSSIPYGIQRMLSIALAHGGDAKLILLDEPGAGLGGHDMDRLRALLTRLKSEGLALIVIEHHMDLIMAVADQIVVLDRGQILSAGTPKEIRSDPQVLEAYSGESRVSAALRAEKVTVDYGGNRVVDVDGLELAEGSLTCIAGANGAGKSSLINSLLGWSRGRPKVSGRVRLGDIDVSPWSTTQRAQAGMLLVPEGFGVFQSLTVAENLAGVRSPAPDSGRQGFSNDRIFELFPRLAERLDHAGSALSGGERGMLAVARALRAGPRILLLDEPSIGLAPRLVSLLLAAIRRLVDDGLTVLLVEQNVRAALDVSDRLYLLERGHVVASGSATEMRGDPRLIDAYLGTGHG